MAKWAAIIAVLVLAMAAAKPALACGGDGCNWPSPTPFPTFTPYPTWTPYPTPTIYPTLTPRPTLTPYPTITPLPTGAPETGPTDGAAMAPIALAVGGIGIALRKIANKLW